MSHYFAAVSKRQWRDFKSSNSLQISSRKGKGKQEQHDTRLKSQFTMRKEMVQTTQEAKGGKKYCETKTRGDLIFLWTNKF